jgi:hypothetical protein
MVDAMCALQRDLHQQLRTESVALHQRVAELTRPLDPEQLVRRPASGGWSVGEGLEHRCLAAEMYAKPLATLIHRAHIDAGAPMREWKPSRLGRWIENRLTKPAKVKSPKPFRPGATPRGGVVEDFLTRDNRELHRMDESTSLDWQDLRLVPPIFPAFLPGLLKLNLGDVFNIHVVHVRRHLAQIERVAAEVASH